MQKEKIDRINELARIAKTRELTEDEKNEQKALREEYILYFRTTLRSGGKEVQNGKA